MDNIKTLTSLWCTFVGGGFETSTKMAYFQDIKNSFNAQSMIFNIYRFFKNLKTVRKGGTQLQKIKLLQCILLTGPNVGTYIQSNYQREISSKHLHKPF